MSEPQSPAAGQFRAKITLYRKGKIVHTYDAKAESSAVDAVTWAASRSLVDAEWADQKWGSPSDVDEAQTASSQERGVNTLSRRVLADQPNAWDGHGRADQLDEYRAAIREDADEIDRLNSIIGKVQERFDSAPHEQECSFGTLRDIDNFFDCSCWKKGTTDIFAQTGGEE